MTYQHCPTCHHDALHDDGVCRWCNPARQALEPNVNSCPQCGTEFPPRTMGGTQKRFCSRRCQQRAWDATNRGQGWRAENMRRQNEKRKHLRSLGIRRSSRLERSA